MTWLIILLVIVFGWILWQDCNDRMVYWLLYPLIGLMGLILQFLVTQNIYIILIQSIINLILISTIILTLFVYTKIILKKNFYNGTIGSGDLLLFFCLCFVFPADAFIILFPCSIITSLILHLFLKKKYRAYTSVPLAGYMSLFFALSFLISLCTDFSLYPILFQLYEH